MSLPPLRSDPDSPASPSDWTRLHRQHSRSFHEHKFVYPVLSRRSKGISVGVNLNPDKVCNFDCVYCQVDRRSDAPQKFVELERLWDELAYTLDLVTSGALFADPQFAAVPAERRRLNDIAFSGDGEPTSYRNFDDLIAGAAEIKSRRGLNAVKMVLITNASLFHKPAVARGLELLDRHQGEIWAKLDAGTAEYFRTIERTPIPFERILENITAAAQVRPVVIQSLFLRLSGEPPPAAEIAAYCDRLYAMLTAGGKISLVQVYTVARPPAESFVTSLTRPELDAIAELVRHTTGLAVEVFAD